MGMDLEKERQEGASQCGEKTWGTGLPRSDSFSRISLFAMSLNGVGTDFLRKCLAAVFIDER
jgi:hypothetical protein